MDSKMRFTFSDTIAGTVVSYRADEDTFTLETLDGRTFDVTLTSQTFAEVVRNLGEAYADATSQMRDMLDIGRMLFAYGIFYPEGDDSVFEANHIVFVGRTSHDFVFERPDWWVDQIREVADFYIRAQFPDGNIDYGEYRTRLTLEGDKLPSDAAGDGHDLADGLRDGERVPAHRRGPLPRSGGEGNRVPARAHALRSTPARASRTGRTASTPSARQGDRRSSPRSSATTTTRSRRTSRSTRSPGRRRRSASPATRRSRKTSR